MGELPPTESAWRDQMDELRAERDQLQERLRAAESRLEDFADYATAQAKDLIAAEEGLRAELSKLDRIIESMSGEEGWEPYEELKNLRRDLASLLDGPVGGDD